MQITSNAEIAPSHLRLSLPTDPCSHVAPSVLVVPQTESYELWNDFLALNSDEETESPLTCNITRKQYPQWSDCQILVISENNM